MIRRWRYAEDDLPDFSVDGEDDVPPFLDEDFLSEEGSGLYYA
ncbi:hypothetical protein [Paenibacillus elgii]|nr:hypothetical protein [Paenibacillus elgii]